MARSTHARFSPLVTTPPFPSLPLFAPSSSQVGVDLARFPAIAEYNKAVEAIPEVGAARGAMFAAAPKA